jgi:hypothetical protein
MSDFGRDQGVRKILPEALVDIPRKNFSRNAEIGQNSHLWMGII